jgi:glucuronosyltransferase
MTHELDSMLSGQHPFIRIVSYAHNDLFKHPLVKLFISYCGVSSVHEFIDAWIPILGIPIIGDQSLQAVRIEHSNIGRQLL